MIEESGAQIIGYDTIDEIGKSAYATTFLARQQSPDRIVSLKILKSTKFDPDELRQLFYNAAKIVKLEHPNIAAVYDIAVSENQHYVASEYIPGQSLKHRGKAGLLPDQILDMMMNLVEALCYAHKKGVAHQNIKLENILVRQDGTLALTDFGISIGMKKNLALFNANLVNTLDNFKIQWDTYSVGRCLYELLTGKPYNKAISGVGEQELPDDCRFLHPLLNRLLDINSKEYIGNMQLLKAEFKNLLDAIPVLGKDNSANRIETRPKPKPKSEKPASVMEDDVKPLDNQISLMELINYFFDSVKDKLAKRKKAKQGKGHLETLVQAKSSTPAVAPGRSQGQVKKQAQAQMPTTVNPPTIPPNRSARKPVSPVVRQTQLQNINATADLDKNESLIKRLVIAVTIVVSLIALFVTLPNFKGDKNIVKSAPASSQTSSKPVKPVKSEGNQAKLDKLFAEADLHWGKNYLTKPKGENAYEVYQKILELDENNQRAREGIARIANYFEQRAQRKKGDGRLKSSLTDVLAGLKIQPNHAGLIILKSELQSRIEEKERRATPNIVQGQSQKPQTPQEIEVEKLIRQAEMQWRQKKLTTPPGDNAYETYLKALELDASNKRAALGLNRMATYFEGRAENSLMDDAFQEGLNFVEQALKITPENERLQLLRNDLKQKVAEAEAIPVEGEKTGDNKESQANVFGNF